MVQPKKKLFLLSTAVQLFFFVLMFFPCFSLLFLFFFHGCIADEIYGNADEMPTSEECGGETLAIPPRDVSNLNLQIVDDDDWLLICDKMEWHDLNLKEYITIDDDVATFKFCEVDEIKVGSDDDSNLDKTSVRRKMKYHHGVKHYLLRRYMAAAPHVSTDVLADVNRLDNFIICKCISTARQTQITEFTWPVIFFFFQSPFLMRTRF